MAPSTTTTTTSTALPLLDHTIILIPYAHLLHPPPWLTQHFTITPGGTHADGKTANSLILFKDGSYIELIAFVDDDPECKDGHWWGNRKEGVIDFALTTTGSAATDVMGAVNARLEGAGLGPAARGGLRYADPVRGGRTRPDGEVMEWEVSFPVPVTAGEGEGSGGGGGVTRGEVPFWCHDVSDREL
ncbi:hypothetical protein LTS18_008599, partial [Coniosporium uncinatum]